ncbi:MAG: hypothetical protein AB3N64_06435 [Puniceicoccaceae bacterium]
MKYPPLTIIAFNRPNLLVKLLGIVSRSYTGYVYFVIDGPREHVESDRSLVEQVLNLANEYLKENPGEILASEVNLGCYHRIKTGIDEVLSRNPYTIILEDDCHPSDGFFDWISILLESYRYDDSVGTVCGTNLQDSGSMNGESYFRNFFPITWGWGTWANAWKQFVAKEEAFIRHLDSNHIKGLCKGKMRYWYWKRIWQRTYSGEIVAWDYRWVLTCLLNDYDCITSSVNLVENVGGVDDATNTAGSPFLFRAKSDPIEISGQSESVTFNHQYDQFLEDTFYSKNLINRIKWLMSKLKEKTHEVFTS